MRIFVIFSLDDGADHHGESSKGKRGEEKTEKVISTYVQVHMPSKGQ